MKTSITTKQVVDIDNGHLSLNVADTFSFMRISIGRIANNLNDLDFNHIQHYIKEHNYLASDDKGIQSSQTKRNLLIPYIDNLENLTMRRYY